MNEWILKKRSIWFHIIIGYFTIGVWPILYFYFKRKAKIERENELREETLKRESEFILNIKGVTFDNEDGISRQDIIKSCVANGNYSAEIRETSYNGDPAFAIFTQYGQIGMIDIMDIQRVKKFYDRIEKCSIVNVDRFSKKGIGEIYSCKIHVKCRSKLN